MKKPILLVLFLSLSYLSHTAQAATLNITVFIAEFYLGSGQMVTSCVVSGGVDSLFIDLHSATAPYNIIDSSKSILHTDGTAIFTFPNSVIGNSYYIAVRNRDLVETWSAAPVVMGSVTNYDFSSARSMAYGSNMVLVDAGPDIFALFIGDINHDGNVDLLDFPPLDYGINHGLTGYLDEDLNADCNADLLDVPILMSVINAGLFSQHP